MTVDSLARVPTERADRYRKQLAAHFGHKTTVEEGPEVTLIRWDWGAVTSLSVTADELLIRVTAPDAEGLHSAQQVTASHLERFAAKDELSVVWQPDQASAGEV
jgi:hypothetical protein